jgi:thiamine kinase-like enzyme
MTPQEAIDRSLALTCWSGAVTAQPLAGGIANHNILVCDAGNQDVVRLGQDIPHHMIMRRNELGISRAAHSTGVSPKVVHAEPAVMVSEYIDSTSLVAEDLQDPVTLAAVVDLIKQAHVTLPAHLRGPVLSFWVFHILRDYAATLRDRGSPHSGQLVTLLQQAATLKQAVGPVEMVLGHNDLLPANILRAIPLCLIWAGWPVIVRCRAIMKQSCCSAI